MGPDSQQAGLLFSFIMKEELEHEVKERRSGVYDKSELGLRIWTVLFSSTVFRESEVKKSLGNYI